MSTYKNGQLPASVLATIPGTSRQVRADLVGAVAALRAAFAAHFGKPLTVTDAYRPLSEQQRIFSQRYVVQAAGGGYYGDVRYYDGLRWVRLRGYASAATPGTSNHGWAQAIDFGSGVNTSLTSDEHLWMRANAPRFGWNHPAWARRSPFIEPWHWEGEPVAGFVSNPVQGGGTVPTLTPTSPIDPIPRLEATMGDRSFAIRDTVTGATYEVNLGTGKFIGYPDPGTRDAVNGNSVRGDANARHIGPPDALSTVQIRLVEAHCARIRAQLKQG